MLYAKLDGTAEILNLNSNLTKAKLNGHSKMVTCIIVNKSDTKIITGSIDTNINIWDFNGNRLLTMNSHKAAITTINLIEKDQFIISSSYDEIALDSI